VYLAGDLENDRRWIKKVVTGGEVMQDGSTGGPLSPTRPAVPPRARSPEATTPNPHALKISRGGDGDPAALDGAFDAVQYVVGVKLIMKPPRASVQFINVTTLRAPSCHLT
jgi:hypothetical protein